MRLLNEKHYQLIFLDLRFGEKDHYNKKYKEFIGFKILKKIRDQQSINFSTPVIIFSASTKIWIVESLIQWGADSYYIKENPLFVLDEEFTKDNYTRFISETSKLFQASSKRFKIWEKIQAIKKKSVEKIHNQNIRRRIEEKLNIGYGMLFKNTTEFEITNFLYTNEVLTYIVFWSLLEEIAKDFYDVDWGSKPKNYSWKIRGQKKFFIEDCVIHERDKGYGSIKFLFPSRKLRKFITKEIFYNTNDGYREFMENNCRRIKLSDQLAVLLHLKLNWDYNKVYSEFLEKLNAYRNSIDFIHGDALMIKHKTISETFKQAESYDKCIQILEFIDTILTN